MFLSSPWMFFTDHVLRAPTLGSMLMCLASSLVGVLVLIRKRSLLGEALSHATYPGVVISVIIASAVFPTLDEGLAAALLVGAFCSALVGLWCIDLLQRHLRVKSDAALCFVLSVFFGIGILIASRIQITHTLWYKKIQIFLYGQAATMTDMHIVLYAVLACVIVVFLFILYRDLEAIHFDRDFARSIGMRIKAIDGMVFFLLTLAIVVGIRSVGVVLMSGMLIAPAVAARQFTHRLSMVFILSGTFGMISGFCGNYLSVEIPQWCSDREQLPLFSLPTGPMILLSASLICLIALLFARNTGLISRLLRVRRFRTKCCMENILKIFWKKGAKHSLSFEEIKHSSGLSLSALVMLLWRLRHRGWVESRENTYQLTAEGQGRAAKIVRLHRLWEVYLVYLGQNVEKVHRNAEEMEHILTPAIEKELVDLLHDPKLDPHQQPIPPPPTERNK